MPSARMFPREWLLACIGVLATAGACSSGTSNGSTGSTSSSSHGTSSTGHTTTTTASTSGTGGAGSTGHGGGGNGGAAQSATASTTASTTGTGGAAQSATASATGTGGASSGTGGAGSTGHGGSGTGGAAQSATASSSATATASSSATASASASSTASGTGGAACMPEVHAAAGLPVDMFLMQDQSGSMEDTVSAGGTKWQAVTSAIDAFAQQSLSGVSIGIQYFALTTSGATCTVTSCTKDSDCGPATCGPCTVITPGFGFCTGAGGGDSCTVADYAKADVEIAPIPGVASAMSTSLAAHSPSTSTPTAPALQGALNHAQTWAASHPGHIVVAVFSTDGEPTECSPTDQASIAQIAATALAGTPSIKTFTIGTFSPADIPSGPDLLDAIAAAGGTGKGFDIGVATTSNASASVLSALNQIRLQALGCQYPIPATNAGPNPNPADVDVQYTPSGGSPAILPQVQDAAHCPASGDAWYYDNPSAPAFILLCASTCTKVDADPAGNLQFLLGCPTVTAP